MAISGKLVNVTIPVYGVEKYLNRCVDSLLEQSLGDFELVLVDDGSTDGCGEICDEYALRDSRIISIHQHNGGLSAARNTGINWCLNISDSKWITFIDSDDWVHRQYLEKLYEACTGNDAKVAMCQYYETAGNTTDISLEMCVQNLVLDPEELWCHYQGQVNGKDKVYLSATVAWGKLYSKELWLDVRYPYGKLHEDEFTTYKILFALDRIVIVPEALIYYFQNPSSIVGSKWNIRRLDVVDALSNQMVYYKENGFMSAFRFARKSYYSLLKSSIHRLKEQHLFVGEKKYRLILKFALLREWKYNYPISEYEGYYLFAYPLIFKIYLYTRSIMNKLKRLIER